MKSEQPILITDEHKRVEETLGQSENMYRLLLEQAPDGVFVSDETGRYEFVNEQACRMLGYSREELFHQVQVDGFYVDSSGILGCESVCGDAPCETFDGPGQELQSFRRDLVQLKVHRPLFLGEAANNV